MGGFYGLQGYKIECEFQFLIMMTERPGFSGLSALQEKEKYVILLPIEKGWRNIYGRKNGRADRRDFKRT